jgi:ABC-type phosphonate transport system ATPase subunit
MKRRLSIGISLVGNPKLILLDEVSGNSQRFVISSQRLGLIQKQGEEFGISSTIKNMERVSF